MKWRRSERRPKWFKDLGNIDEAENKRAYKVFKTEKFKPVSKPRRSRYGSLKILKKPRWKEPSPLIDVFQEKDSILVVAELKGFNRENIKTHVEGQRLVLSARAQGRRYYKSLNLPVAVIPETMRITYKNGVLEIRLRKALEEKAIKKLAG
ncbi:MAG: Hsp20/alpha crystallin family protein [Nitrososphaerota archaeon]|nr:Hsp20/alpha crystallin family protein [Candidatus Bathyarchaeota archaeon]MDW8023133.1 Hsp20/alpha crystallin family protein [Nitrososphaerota archaeon]